jgi:hypothetical protein
MTPKDGPRGKWINAERGDGLYVPENPRIRDILQSYCVDEGIVYKNGYPDFVDVKVDEVKVSLTASRQENFDAAYAKFAKKGWGKNAAEAEKNIKAAGLTAHEVEDGKTVQLVDSEVHRYFGHYGGVAEQRAAQGVSKASEKLEKAAKK